MNMHIDMHIDMRARLRTETLTTVVMLAHDTSHVRTIQLASREFRLSPTQSYDVRCRFRQLSQSTVTSMDVWVYRLPNNHRDGPHTIYYTKFGPEHWRTMCNYVNDVQHGVCTVFSKRVGMVIQFTYVNDKKHGEYKQWNADGTLSEHSYYDRGRRHGPCVNHFTSIPSTRYINFINGDAQGESITIDSHGHVLRRSHYVDGVLHGSVAMWHPTGQQYEQSFYTNNVRDGEFTIWHPNGQIYKQYHYVRGKLHGRYRKWDTAGRLTTERMYENDQLVDV